MPFGLVPVNQLGAWVSGPQGDVQAHQVDHPSMILFKASGRATCGVLSTMCCAMCFAYLPSFVCAACASSIFASEP